MIPVETVMGITQGWRFIQEHPVVTWVVIAVLLGLAVLAIRQSRLKHQGKNIFRAVALSLVIGAAGFYGWAYNTRGPSLAAQLHELAGQVAAERSLNPPAAN